MLYAAYSASDVDEFQARLAERRCESVEFMCDICRSATIATCEGEAVQDGGGICFDLAQVVPVGLLNAPHESILLAAAHDTLSIAHPSGDASIAAQFIALCSYRLLRREAIMTLLNIDGRIDDLELYHTLLRVGHVVGWGSVSRALRHIGRTNNRQLAAAALYLAIRYDDQPLEAIKAAAEWHPACVSLTAAFSVAVRQDADFLSLSADQIAEVNR